MNERDYSKMAYAVFWGSAAGILSGFILWKGIDLLTEFIAAVIHWMDCRRQR
jgi:hypothetical protein